jgi:hypothetical protein
VSRLLRQPHGFELPRRLCLGRIFLVAPGVMVLALPHEPDAEPTCQLDQDPDAGQHVDGGEDLQRVMRQREVRVGDARRGQRADGELEPVDHVPAFAKRIGDRPDHYEGDRGSRDDGEVLFLGGVLHCPQHAPERGQDGQHAVRLASVADGWIKPRGGGSSASLRDPEHRHVAR